MSLATDIANKRQLVAKPKRCKFGDLLDSLDTEDEEAMKFAIKAVLEDIKGYTITWLVDILNKNDHSIGKTVISDHLAGRCSCDNRQ